MKKFVAIIMVAAMVFALAACGGGSNAPANNNANTAATWPNGEVTIYEGYEAGSLTDVNVITIKDWIVNKTGAKVTIENDKQGGGANLAAKLVKATPDGQTIMLFGMNNLSNYIQGIWQLDPTDANLFKPVCGTIQPYPYSGCVLLTHKDNPYNTWDELVTYIEANPGKVTVMDIPGKVMDSKTKSLFYQLGLEEKVTWAPTSSAESTAGLLGNTINIVMLDETTAAKLLADTTTNPIKAIINCRPDNDFSYYPEGSANMDIIKSIPTLLDVFGAEKAAQYNLANFSFFVVPAGTPDEICNQIKAVVDAIDDEAASEDVNSFYARCRTNGGTTKYWDKNWSSADLQKEFSDAMAKLKLFLK